MSKVKYYDGTKAIETGADYIVVYGERSNGKTTFFEGYGLKEHIESGYVNQLAIIRRWEEDFKGKNGQQMFDAIINIGWIEEWTKGKYNSVFYYGQRWYLCLYDADGNKIAQEENPFCLGFSISSEEHYKSTSYPNITNILFDEFITRSYYLPNEFISFQNLLSTIIRLRTNVKIFMCGNTINKYCPYFNEMGLSGIKNQKRGTIDVYSYGDSELKVAVEYSDFDGKSKKSNKYFAFGNPKLEMITNGTWEMSIYPHLPCKYLPKELKYIFFIKFDDELLQCEIINSHTIKSQFIYIHRKTTPIQDDNKGLVFQQEPDARPNYRRRINKPSDELGKLIYSFFLNDKVFYQDNEVGEIIRNYVLWATKESLTS